MLRRSPRTPGSRWLCNGMCDGRASDRDSKLSRRILRQVAQSLAHRAGSERKASVLWRVSPTRDRASCAAQESPARTEALWRDVVEVIGGRLDAGARILVRLRCDARPGGESGACTGRGEGLARSFRTHDSSLEGRVCKRVVASPIRRYALLRREWLDSFFSQCGTTRGEHR